MLYRQKGHASQALSRLAPEGVVDATFVRVIHEQPVALAQPLQGVRVVAGVVNRRQALGNRRSGLFKKTTVAHWATSVVIPGV